jgi:hypothetical protein
LFLFPRLCALAFPSSLRRDLTLIAKVLQKLANLLLFNEKEPYMDKVNPWLLAKVLADVLLLLLLFFFFRFCSS